MLAEILSWEILIPIILIVVLFGGSQIPKMARSLGSAKSEFEKGIKEGQADSDRKAAERAEAATAFPPAPPPPAAPPAATPPPTAPPAAPPPSPTIN